MSQYPLTLVFCFVAAVFLLVAGVFSIVERANAKASPPWTILCSDSGMYSYTDEYGIRTDKEYAKREEAEKEMDESKKWNEEYESKRASGYYSRKEKAKEALDKQFKPCK